MTKFTKGILTLGFIVGLGVGGKYGYDYLKDRGYFDDIAKTNVPQETVDYIEEFLNDKSNIGFIEVNYSEINVQDFNINTITSLLYLPYEKGSDGKLNKIDYKTSNELIKSYDANLLNQRVCYDKLKLTEHIYSITNQNFDLPETFSQSGESLGICAGIIDSYLYMIDVDVELVIANGTEYKVQYNIKDINNMLYNQKYNYGDLNTRSYTGNVVLERIDDDSYIFVSNEIPGAKSLYDF